jgi:hypothetical protein
MASSLTGVLFGVKVELLEGGVGGGVTGLVPSLFRHVVGSLAAVGVVGVGLAVVRHCFSNNKAAAGDGDVSTFKQDLTELMVRGKQDLMELMVRGGPTAVALTVLAGHVIEADGGVE